MAQPTTTLISVQTKPDLTRRHKVIEYTFQFADAGAPTYPAGGIVVDLTLVTNPKGYERAKWASAALPANAAIQQVTLPNGYVLTLQQAAANPTMKNFVIRVWTAPGTELGNGAAIPAALFAALIANGPALVFRLRDRNYN